jgi:hypothetical protein
LNEASRSSRPGADPANAPSEDMLSDASPDGWTTAVAVAVPTGDSNLTDWEPTSADRLAVAPEHGMLSTETAFSTPSSRESKDADPIAIPWSYESFSLPASTKRDARCCCDSTRRKLETRSEPNRMIAAMVAPTALRFPNPVASPPPRATGP